MRLTSTQGHLPGINLSAVQLVLLVSAFVAVTANLAFFEKLTDVYPLNIANGVFLVSIAVLVFAFTALLQLLFSTFIPVRVVCSVFLILAAITGYFNISTGIIVDANMIRNIVETDTREALELVNLNMILYLAILGVIPAAVVWIAPLQSPLMRREIFHRFRALALLIVLMAACILPLSNHYASFFREHKEIRSYINPTFAVYSTGKFINQKIKASRLPEFITLAHSVERPAINTTRKLVILVIGETVRSDHMSLNGYSRNTNPALSHEQQLISYRNISSCGTSTAVSVPCMFAFAGHDDFAPDEAEHTENALDILQRAGVSVLWRDNNSDSKGVATRIHYEDYKSAVLNKVCDPECRDVGMLTDLQQYIDTHDGDKLIVLHQMGSHGPAYYKRYPESFEFFKPACHSAELSECSDEEIINAYDNTILYTDYFLSKVIELLKQNAANYQATMLYVSDHGESLGESGIYLHGLPYVLAPAAQTKVPLILWSTDTADVDLAKTTALKALPNSHDAIFPTLLQLFNVFTNLHPAEDRPLLYLKS